MEIKKLLCLVLAVITVTLSSCSFQIVNDDEQSSQIDLGFESLPANSGFTDASIDNAPAISFLTAEEFISSASDYNIIECLYCEKVGKADIDIKYPLFDYIDSNRSMDINRLITEKIHNIIALSEYSYDVRSQLKIDYKIGLLNYRLVSIAFFVTDDNDLYAHPEVFVFTLNYDFNEQKAFFVNDVIDLSGVTEEKVENALYKGNDIEAVNGYLQTDDGAQLLESFISYCKGDQNNRFGSAYLCDGHVTAFFDTIFALNSYLVVDVEI